MNGNYFILQSLKCKIKWRTALPAAQPTSPCAATPPWCSSRSGLACCACAPRCTRSLPPFLPLPRPDETERLLCKFQALRDRSVPAHGCRPACSTWGEPPPTCRRHPRRHRRLSRCRSSRRQRPVHGLPAPYMGVDLDMGDGAPGELWVEPMPPHGETHAVGNMRLAGSLPSPCIKDHLLNCILAKFLCGNG